MKVISALWLAILMWCQISHAYGPIEVAGEEPIAEGILPAIQKLQFDRYGGGAKSFEITAQDDGYLLFLKMYQFREVNRNFVIPRESSLALILDKLFKQENHYQHYSYYHDAPTGTWRYWEFFDHNNVSLLAIADQEYARGLAGLGIGGIESLVEKLVKDDFSPTTVHASPSSW